MRTHLLFAMALAGVLAVGCATDEGDEVVAAVDFALMPNPNFSGNSVEICGTRVDNQGRYLPADSKYPCLNQVDCTCFGFNESGEVTKLFEPWKTAYWGDLCPSDDVPKAKWEFTYKIFTDNKCKGDVINACGNDNNMVCYDADDMFLRHHPNRSMEWLEVGDNHNKLICLTRNAGKDWEFDVCIDMTPQDGLNAAEGFGYALYDCGCELAGPHIDGLTPPGCRCPQGELAEYLPFGCYMNFWTGCKVRCGWQGPMAAPEP